MTNDYFVKYTLSQFGIFRDTKIQKSTILRGPHPMNSKGFNNWRKMIKETHPEWMVCIDSWEVL